ncbi:MAG: lactonase family protein [Terrimicrobiaceae bacterium]
MKLGDQGLHIPHQVLPFQNPEFLCQHPEKMTFYTVNVISDSSRQKQSAVGAFRYDPVTGNFEMLNQQPVGGNGPCHVAIDRTGRLVVTANYGDGSVSAFPVRPDGSLGAESDLKTHEGSGPNTRRQSSPHAHGVTFCPDNRFLLVPDLGTDEVRVYRVDLENARLEKHGAVRVAPGAGPRHLSFSPEGQQVYLVNELDNTVTALSWNRESGGLASMGSVRTLPAGFDDENTTAEIAVHPDGAYVYASNRGHNSVVIFGRDPDSGELTTVGHLELEGREPRSFAVSPDGGWLVVGNQHLNTVSAFRIREGGARFEKVGDSVPVPSPVCVHFVLQE